MMQNLAQSPTAIASLHYDRLRRILVISIDGQGAQDDLVAQHRIVGGLFSLLGLVSGGQIDRYNFETLNTVTDQLHAVVGAVCTARCEQGRLFEGQACDDVQGELVHISLTEMPDSPEKRDLLAIPTGLTLQPQDVDRLIAAGQSAVTTSEPLHRFLADYPPSPAVVGPIGGKGAPKSFGP